MSGVIDVLVGVGLLAGNFVGVYEGGMVVFDGVIVGPPGVYVGVNDGVVVGVIEGVFVGPLGVWDGVNDRVVVGDFV